MTLRNGVVLGLTLIGILLLVAGVSEDRRAAEIGGGLGCLLLAYVYVQMTSRRGDR